MRYLSPSSVPGGYCVEPPRPSAAGAAVEPVRGVMAGVTGVCARDPAVSPGGFRVAGASSVGADEMSTAAPHEGQNRLVSAISAPQLAQYMAL